VTALSHLRVLELSKDVSAAYCARQFAAWGADVAMLEGPEGAPLRRRGSLVKVEDGGGVSTLWSYVGANKRSVRLSDDPGDLVDLLGRADVFITDWRQEDLAARGVELDALRRLMPRLVVISITPFGLDGPYATFEGADLVVEALSGYLALNGLPGRPPLRSPGRITGFAVGVNAFVGALAALIRRERCGRGDLVEVSGIETLATVVPFLRVQYVGADKVREGGTEAGVRILPCSDGWVSFLVVDPSHRELFGEVFGIDGAAWPTDLAEAGYGERVARMVAFLSPYTRAMTADAVFEALEARGVVCGKVIDPAALPRLPQLDSRGYWRPADDPVLGAVRHAGPPAKLRNGDTVPIRPAPSLDAAIGLEAVGWPERLETAPAAADGQPPLAGFKVLDLTQAWIGPLATLIMADLGADVIKIESHKRPDVWRQASPQPTAITTVLAERVNRSFYFNSVNRNKRNLALDLRSPDGRALFLRLAKNADVVAENYTARVMDRFGLGYDVLAAAKPDLVMLSSSGFGKTGPWSDYKTNGSAVECLAGWDWLHRYPGGEPILMGFYQADAICGLQMAAVTLLSLLTRVRTGRGEAIDASMLEAATGYVGDLVLQAQCDGEIPLAGNRSPDFAPHGVFPCQGDDRWIAIAVADDTAWSRLAGLPGAPEALSDPRWRTLAGRRADEDAVEAALAAWTRLHDADALMRLLQAAQVAAGVVRGCVEALHDPHLKARDWFKPMTHPDLGEHLYNGFPWRFGECPLSADLPPPRLGEHSRAILTERLGLTADEIDRLEREEVTGSVL
jgi:crotonobetainyl-CoA:carnitine CoA-transferase CaiB-like acyl-CoA transferase